MKEYKNNIEILGKKIGMTQFFTADNKLVPVTVVEAGPCSILQIKTLEKEGYNAVQIGFQKRKETRATKAQLGHVKKSNSDPVMKTAEFRTENLDQFTLGNSLGVSNFAEGEKVDVISVTKGKGFQGVVKRWGFAGGPASHGSMWHRRGGSYGNCQWPGEVMKGKKMPGRMGGKQKTVQNLEIVKIFPEKNLLLIKGTFPGANGSTVTIRKAKKVKPAKAA